MLCSLAVGLTTHSVAMEIAKRMPEVFKVVTLHASDQGLHGKVSTCLSGDLGLLIGISSLKAINCHATWISLSRLSTVLYKTLAKA